MINKMSLQLGKERSAIRELFEQGKKLKEKFGEKNVYDFSIGNPYVACPKIINDTLIDILDTANKLDKGNLVIESNNTLPKHSSILLHGYTSAEGDKITRNAISEHLNNKYHAHTDSNLIYMSSGAASALTITIKALTSGEGNDEIILFSPFFPEYKVFIANANAKSILVKPNYSTFYPDFDDFESKITENTQAVIINSPNNPTGVLYNENMITKICEILKNKETEYGHPIYIISDEPYRELIYTNAPYPFITNYYANSIITYSYSKSLSLPGERIGYILVNPECENANEVFSAICGSGRSLGYVCAPTLFQHLIPYITNYTSDFSIYKENSIELYNSLTKIGYEVVKPDGAFYLFVKSLEDDDERFSQNALKYNILIVPSKSFGVNGYVRIAYCVEKERIINSIPLFQKLFDSYKN